MIPRLFDLPPMRLSWPEKPKGPAERSLQRLKAQGVPEAAPSLGGLLRGEYEPAPGRRPGRRAGHEQAEEEEMTCE